MLLDELKSSRSVYGKDFPNFEMLDAKIASALNKIIQNSQFKKKVRLEEQKAQKEDRFPRGRQSAFMIPDYFRVTGAHDTVLDDADLFSVTLRGDNVQEFDTRWDEVLLSMSKVPSDDIEDTWVWSTQNRVTLVRHGNSSEDIDARWSEVEDDGEMEHSSETSITKFRRRKRENWDRNIGYESQGIKWHWERKRIFFQRKAKGQCSRGDQCSFRHESHDREKPTQKAAPSSEPPTPRGRSASRKRSLRGRRQSGEPTDSLAKTSWKVLALSHFVTSGIRPECQFCKSQTGCKFSAECSFRTGGLRNNPTKGRRRVMTKVQQLLCCVSQDLEPPESVTISRKGTKSLGTNSTSTIHKSCASSSKHPRKKRSIAEETTSQKFSSAQSLRREIWGQISRKRPKDKCDAPAETRGNWPRISWRSQKRTKATSFPPTNE